jgi:membrane carboxypeptidase/penicillin-binding protein PbpC
LRLFQNPVSFEQALGKSGQMPAFSLTSKVAVSKLAVLKQPHL